MTQELIITKAAAGERLDVAVAALTDHTRSQIQKQLGQGLISLNGQPANARMTVAEGDVVTVDQPPPQETPLIPELSVLYEDDDMLVIDKPAGLVVHLSESGRPQPTVAAFVADRGVDDDDVERPGIVHRLDKDTSGVMLIAKNPAAKSHLQTQFRERHVEKTYLALLSGRLRPPEATIRLPIGRDRRRPTKRAVVPSGRPSTTHYRVLQELEGATLAEVRLETGRTHQIRVHFAHLGHPVVGDQLYGGMVLGGITRQFLHATHIELVTPSGKTMSFDSPLPAELQQVVERLGGTV
jgi:23S rRNA pseudouridine1911/1915/1917 synthase